MRLLPTSLILASAAPAIGAVLDIIGNEASEILHEVDNLLHPDHSRYIEVYADHHDLKTDRKGKLCVLHPVEEGYDDENFKKAVDICGDGGIVRLPDANYTIGSPMTTKLNNALLDVHGWISFSDDIDHWVKNRVPFEFQNLALAWIIEGENYVLDGNDKGGIFGNGQTWYSWAKDEGNKYGRPMSFAITNSKNVVVKNWSVIQPQFWASIVINSTDVLYRDYYVNATSYDPEADGSFLTWLQNTDGCDTYRSHNVTFENMVYQGGDDCLALKPNSSMITARNVTCYGGTGIAFGSIGQYKANLDYIDGVYMEDINLYPSTQHKQKNGLYFKSWMGREFGEPPNGGGGGRGFAKNITVKNVHIEDNIRPVFFSTDLTYLLEHQRDGKDTGVFQWHNITIENVTGTSLNNRVVYMDCSKAMPCWDITYKDFDVKPGKTDDDDIHFVCNNVVLGGDDGLNACHPSNSEHESAYFEQ